MPETTRDPSPPTDVPSPASPVAGRGRRIAEIGRVRLASSWVLKISAVAAFMGYGGLIALLLAGKLGFRLAAMVALMSMASWFFLFWWLPVLECTRQRPGADPRRMAIGAALLEAVAFTCIVLVHGLMIIIVVYAART